MKKIKIGSWIFIGLIVGTLAGIIAKSAPAPLQPTILDFVEQIKPLGGLFNRIIFMVVVPIVFCSLVSGIASMGGGKISAVGAKYYKLAAVMVAASIVIAFTLVTIVKPGKNASEIVNAAPAIAELQKQPILQTIVEFVPSNPFEAIVNANKGGLIPIMVFAAFIGFSLAGRPNDSILRKVNDEILAVSIRVVDFAMFIAPISITILIFTTIVTTGFDRMASLMSYVGVLLGALAIQQCVVFSAVLISVKKSPLKFWSDAREVIATALATASSAVTTPVAMRVAEEKLGMKPDVSRVVLTLGVTGAKTATSMFQVIAVLFVAQMANVELTLTHYALLSLTAFVSGIVTAGIPSAAIPVIAGLMATVSVPAELIGLIVSVDRILDMFRTAVNVNGNLVIAEAIAGKAPTKPATKSRTSKRKR